MRIIAGIDLGGTAVNYTLLNEQEKFLIEGLCEHPARSKEGARICFQQIADGLAIAAAKAGIQLTDIVSTGLDTPGPASATGVLSARGSTNFRSCGLVRLRYPCGLWKLNSESRSPT